MFVRKENKFKICLKKMKKIILFLLITQTSFAINLKSNVKITIESSKVISVSVQENNYDGNITINGLDNDFYYTEKIISKSKYFKKFNLGNLKPGLYSIKIKDEKSSLIHNVQVNSNSVKFISTNRYSKPFIQLNEEKKLMKLVFLGDLTEKAKVEIINENGDIIQKMYNTKFNLNLKNFKFKNPGVYLISIKQNNEIFEEVIMI